MQRRKDMAKIEFRCSEEEKQRVRKNADRKGESVKEYVLNSTIYARGRKGISGRFKSAICRIDTTLNKIQDGIDVEKEMKKLVEECEELCQYL